MLGMNYSIIIDELTKILDQERIEYTMTGPLSGVPRWFAYVFLPIGALALAGGVLLLALPARKGSTAPAPGAAESEKNTRQTAAALYVNPRFCGALRENTPDRNSAC